MKRFHSWLSPQTRRSQISADQLSLGRFDEPEVFNAAIGSTVDNLC
jgi:hypothetical protein